MEASGLPLLSGPPPHPPPSSRADIGCRRCSKEFNMLFSRARKCDHCGYSYCQNCSDYQALIPKEGADGYEITHVCGFCIEFLNITASRKSALKAIPLAKLRKYAAAYNINIQHAVEKDDIIDILVAARTQFGCLPRANENFYRTYSVPDRVDYTRPRGLFSRPGPNARPPPPPPLRPQTAPAPEFPRPDLAPDDPPPVPPRPRPANVPPHVPPRPQTNYNPHYMYPTPSFNSYPNRTPPTPPRASRPARSSSNLRGTAAAANNTPRPRATSATPAPPPTLDRLLEMTPEAVRSLSISALKTILFNNHVNAGSGILEKDDLVRKVTSLIEDEKRERERQRLAEEREEQEKIETQRRMMEEYERKKQEAEKAKEGQDRIDEDAADAAPQSSASSSPPPMPKPQPSVVERSGLCVICQDEEANIAIVDCGHLAMCRACSELVMDSSRECPLCRTRIVTEARLLRIFKT